MLQTYSGQQSNIMHILQSCWIWGGKFQLLVRSVFAVREADSSAAFYYHLPSVLGRRLGTALHMARKQRSKTSCSINFRGFTWEQHVCIAQTLALQTKINCVEALPYLRTNELGLPRGKNALAGAKGSAALGDPVGSRQSCAGHSNTAFTLMCT